ncbi:Phage P2 GpU protein [Novosphingobium nitrogenifigens DSM 19370]|uniref:Phage P2 GpU protein n=1 Tax=Novosphingobium nitrogenifigens DSM 19370 TaxID=983920 RepID=F1Z9C9_9SPHN|nr:phage tail protein [Novosphingobium nitrogenifigens]EGD58376.1 Phage P2 GpU protein [Novosphingobium nitrogenifigens DSM 19370]
MFAALGLFVFTADSLLFDELQRARGWRHGSTDRFGARAASQFLGPGEDTITLPGKVVPELAGRYSSLDRLAAMADTGEGYILMNGAGTIFGTYVITRLDETHRALIDTGVARAVDFTIELKRVDDGMAMTGTIAASAGGWQ